MRLLSRLLLSGSRHWRVEEGMDLHWQQIDADVDANPANTWIQLEPQTRDLGSFSLDSY